MTMAELMNILQSISTPLTSLIIVLCSFFVALRSLSNEHETTTTFLKLGLPQPAPATQPPQTEAGKVTPPAAKPDVATQPQPRSAPNEMPTPAPKLTPLPSATPTCQLPPKPLPTTADRFAECMAFVWPEEGGFSNDPQDHGGPTNLGVTEEDLAQVGLPHTLGDIKALTKDVAANRVYRPLYWNAMHCDELPAGVDLEVFDLGINAGIHEAAKLLQKDVGTAQDGVIGPLTLAAAHAKPSQSIIATFNNERVTFYKSLKQFDRFGRDWLKRSADCYALATKMAKAVS